MRFSSVSLIGLCLLLSLVGCTDSVGSGPLPGPAQNDADVGEAGVYVVKLIADSSSATGDYTLTIVD